MLESCWSDSVDETQVRQYNLISLFLSPNVCCEVEIKLIMSRWGGILGQSVPSTSYTQFIAIKVSLIAVVLNFYFTFLKLYLFCGWRLWYLSCIHQSGKTFKLSVNQFHLKNHHQSLLSQINKGNETGIDWLIKAW